MTLTQDIFLKAKAAGKKDVYLSLAREAWNYAIISILICVSFQLLAVGVLAYKTYKPKKKEVLHACDEAAAEATEDAGDLVA